MSLPKPGSDATLSQWLDYLELLHHKPIELGLDRVQEVARRLDLLGMPAVKIIVGGTNGKGSTCAMLEAILLAAGYKVGMYTSPHLIDFNERIRVNGALATDEQIIEQLREIEEARGEVSLSYFEYTTLAALRLFQKMAVDVMVLEVGLGGRLDAVNIIDADCSIVTSVDMDHMEWLGDTREKIGWEKAHIFRSGKPAICADPVPPDTLVAHARDIGADLWRFGRDFNYSGDRLQWANGGRSRRRTGLGYPALRGANQLLNASAALAALEALEGLLLVPQQAVRLGLAQAALPGRFQTLPGLPVTVLDVAHNPHAAAALGQNLDAMQHFPATHAVVGMLRDKDIAGVVARLATRVDHWYCATLEGPRGTTGEALADIVRHVTAAAPERQNTSVPSSEAHREGGHVVARAVRQARKEPLSILSFATPEAAFAAAREHATDNDRILVFGSFATVGPVLQSLSRKTN
jgi:dihydrofolate synthase/folylpolyglutamate synthase